MSDFAGRGRKPPPFHRPPSTDAILSIFDSARFLISAAKLQGLPPEGLPEIAFAGRSNAGKSTTINVLTRQTRLAFASKTPGRTQLVNFFLLSRKTASGEREEVTVRSPATDNELFASRRSGDSRHYFHVRSSFVRL